MTVSETVRMQQAETRSRQRERYTPMEARALWVRYENRNASVSSIYGAAVDAVLDAIDMRDAIREANRIAPGLSEVWA